MRLGQLARKLDVSTADIITFLQTKGIEKKDHPNVKLDEDMERDVIAHFEIPGDQPSEAPTPLPETSDTTEDVADTAEDTKSSDITPEEKPEPEDEPLTADAPTVQGPDATSQEPSTPVAEEEPLAETTEEKDEDSAGVENEENPYEGVDIIKAPKVELPGLKVVGKIDLPEPKPKEEAPEEAEEQPKEAEEETPKVRYAYHDRRNSRKRLTPEEREARRLKNQKAKEKRMAREAEKRKERELKRQKAKKAEHYKKKLEQKAVSPKIKTQKATAPKKRKKQEPKQPKPKTLLGKFWRWLNT